MSTLSKFVALSMLMATTSLAAELGSEVDLNAEAETTPLMEELQPAEEAVQELDTAVEGAGEVSVDAGVETTTEAEAGTEVEVESGTEVEVEAPAEVGVEAEGETLPQADGETLQDYMDSSAATEVEAEGSMTVEGEADIPPPPAMDHDDMMGDQ